MANSSKDRINYNEPRVKELETIPTEKDNRKFWYR